MIIVMCVSNAFKTSMHIGDKKVYDTKVFSDETVHYAQQASELHGISQVRYQSTEGEIDHLLLFSVAVVECNLLFLVFVK